MQENVGSFIAFQYFCKKKGMDVGYGQARLFTIDSRNLHEYENIVRNGHNGFLLCMGGNISLVLDEKIYKLGKNDLYIYPAFADTQVDGFSEDFRAIAGLADFNSVVSSLLPVSDSQSYVFMRFHPHVSLEQEQVRRIGNVFTLICQRESSGSALEVQTLSLLHQALCYEIVDAYMAKRAKPSGRQSRKDKIFQSFLMDLHQHFRQHREVAFYAELQYITPRHFATQIHDKSGKTPLQWITLFTISESKRLLDNPKMSIKEIAEVLNFPEQASFGRYFKQHTGTSPTEYRLLCQIK